MTPLYDDPSSVYFQNPADLDELLNLATDLPIFNEDLPFDNRPYLIPLYKPAGVSSFDVIRTVRSQMIKYLGKGKGRRKLKIGHFGTLDPFAEGLLLVGSGKAMKLMNLIQEQLPKTYMAIGKIGVKTITGDCEGEVISYSEHSDIFLDKIYDSIELKAKALKGEYWQRPPYFSAVKHEGRALYEYAREGVFIDKPRVQRYIYDLSILENPIYKKKDEVSFCSKVSNGTYIRTLWQDLLSDFNEEGHLNKLIRTEIGKLTLAESISPEEFNKKEELVSVSPDQVVSLDKISFEGSECIDLLQGRSLWGEYKVEQGIFWAYFKNYLIGLGEVLNREGDVLEVKIKTLLFGLNKREGL